MNVITTTDGTEQSSTNILPNDTPLQLPMFRHEEVIEPTRKKETIAPFLYPSPSPPPSIPAANSTKEKKKKKNGKHKYITRFAPSSSSPSSPGSCHPTFPLLVPDWQNSLPCHPRHSASSPRGARRLRPGLPCPDARSDASSSVCHSS